MSKPTPGPWKVTPDSFVMTDDRPSIGIAKVITHTKEFPANARLIAAAPDLLEALKSIEWITANCPAFCPDCGHDRAAGHHSKYCQLAAAIAKAEGK